MVLMGSGAECAHETVEHLVGRGERVGVLKVRLFRPFSAEHFLEAIPLTAADARCARPHQGARVGGRAAATGGGDRLCGCGGARCAIQHASHIGRPFWPWREGVHAGDGQGGVSTRRATVAPRTRFTLGIRDDVSGSSLAYDPEFDLEPDDVRRAVFYGLGSDGTVSANKASIKIIGEHDATLRPGPLRVRLAQGGLHDRLHLRFGPRPIRSTYRIRRAQFVGGPRCRSCSSAATSSTRDARRHGACSTRRCPRNTSLSSLPHEAQVAADRAPMPALRHRRICRGHGRRPGPPHQHGDAGVLLRAREGAFLQRRPSRHCESRSWKRRGDGAGRRW